MQDTTYNDYISEIEKIGGGYENLIEHYGGDYQDEFMDDMLERDFFLDMEKHGGDGGDIEIEEITEEETTEEEMSNDKGFMKFFNTVNRVKGQFKEWNVEEMKELNDCISKKSGLEPETYQDYTQEDNNGLIKGLTKDELYEKLWKDLKEKSYIAVDYAIVYSFLMIPFKKEFLDKTENPIQEIVRYFTQANDGSKTEVLFPLEYDYKKDILTKFYNSTVIDIQTKKYISDHNINSSFEHKLEYFRDSLKKGRKVLEIVNKMVDESQTENMKIIAQAFADIHDPLLKFYPYIKNCTDKNMECYKLYKAITDCIFERFFNVFENLYLIYKFNKNYANMAKKPLDIKFKTTVLNSLYKSVGSSSIVVELLDSGIVDIMKGLSLNKKKIADFSTAHSYDFESEKSIERLLHKFFRLNEYIKSNNLSLDSTTKNTINRLVGILNLYSGDNNHFGFTGSYIDFPIEHIGGYSKPMHKKSKTSKKLSKITSKPKSSKKTKKEKKAKKAKKEKRSKKNTKSKINMEKVGGCPYDYVGGDSDEKFDYESLY